MNYPTYYIKKRGRKRNDAVEQKTETPPVVVEEKSRYSPKPAWMMTNAEAYSFACRQAQEASDHIRTTDGRMTMEDMQYYAGAIYESILYFNRRDPRHRDHMRYLREVRRMELERMGIGKR